MFWLLTITTAIQNWSFLETTWFPPRYRELTFKEIVIEDNVWIADGSWFCQAQLIKEGSIIAANTVVNGVVDARRVHFGKHNWMRITHKPFIRRVVSPSKIFISIYILFLLMPSFLIYSFKHYENLWINVSYSQYDASALLFFSISMIGLYFFTFIGLVSF